MDGWLDGGGMDDGWTEIDMLFIKVTLSVHWMLILMKCQHYTVI